MANSDPVPASKALILLGDVAQNTAVSEALMAKIGGVLNAINNAAYNDMSFIMSGYVADMTNNASDGWGGNKLITADVNISEYYLTLNKSGTSGSVQFNANVYDETGALVNTLFSSAISVSGNNGIRVGVKRDVENTTTFSVNDAGHTINFGTLNLTALFKNYTIAPFIVGGKNGAKNLNFNLKLKEV